MSEGEIRAVAAVFERRTGLTVDARTIDRLERIARERMRTLGIESLQRYVAQLETGEEWREVAREYTNRETFFLRDAGQMAVIRDVVLPRRIAKRQQNGRLRVWSAGCSTGEEVYSLAMLIADLAPPGLKWDVVGTDINDDALSQAREGIYRPHALRRVTAEMRARFFTLEDGLYRVGDELRSHVSFMHHNLAKDAAPASDLDLIVCRNVFIYMAPATVRAAVARFIPALALEGYLITGHTEVTGYRSPHLVPELHVGGITYRRHVGGLPPRAPAPTTRPASKPAPPRPRARVVPGVQAAAPPPADAGLAETAMEAGDYARAVQLAAGVLDARPDDLHALKIHVEASLSLGKTDECAARCEQAIERTPLSARPYRLLAVLAEGQGDVQRARRLIEKALYLEPDDVSAHLELAWMHEANDRPADALRSRRNALALLRAMPASDVPPGHDRPAAELAAELEALLATVFSEQ